MPRRLTIIGVTAGAAVVVWLAMVSLGAGSALAQCGDDAPATLELATLAPLDTDSAKLEYVVEDSYGEYAPDQIVGTRELEIDGQLYVAWSSQQDGDWFFTIAPLARDRESVGTHRELGRSDMYGGAPKLVRAALVDAVDGPDPELVVIYRGSHASNDAYDGEGEDESPGVDFEQTVLLDTSLHTLATLEGATDGTYDTEGATCSATVTLEDTDCDGRRELVSRRRCAVHTCWDRDGKLSTDAGCEPRDETLTSAIATSRPAEGPPPLPTERIADASPFLVIAGGFPQRDAESRSKAEDLAVRLRAEGFDEARVHDSRQFEELACCFVSVIVSRHATREEADAAAASAQSSGFEAYVKQGFFDTAPLPAVSSECSELSSSGAAVLRRKRGYRLRPVQCAASIQVEAFDAKGRRKKAPTLFAWQGAVAPAPVAVHTLGDASGVAQALVVELVDGGGDARLVLVISGDKDSPALPYVATLPTDASVTVEGDRLVMRRGAAARRLGIDDEGRVILERGDDDAQLAPPAGWDAARFTFEAGARD